jgi:hypothetical protein
MIFFTIVNFTLILLNFEVNTLKFNISIKKTPTIMVFFSHDSKEDSLSFY